MVFKSIIDCSPVMFRLVVIIGFLNLEANSCVKLWLGILKPINLEPPNVSFARLLVLLFFVIVIMAHGPSVINS